MFRSGRRPGLQGRRLQRPPARFELAAARRPQQRRPRLRLPFSPRHIALFALVGVALGGVAYGASWLLLGDTLRVHDVTVVGTQIADPFEVATASGAVGSSLLTLDTEAVVRGVMALPGVREATVHRDWPRGLVIDITEHQGWGYWQASGQRHVIDVDGRVLARSRPPAADAPTIVEIGPPGDGPAPDADAVRLVGRLLAEGAFGRLGVRPTGFVFDRTRGLIVHLEDGPSVVLGDSHDFEFKLEAWAALIERIERDALDVRELDLRFGDHLVMR